MYAQPASRCTRVTVDGHKQCYQLRFSTLRSVAVMDRRDFHTAAHATQEGNRFSSVQPSRRMSMSSTLTSASAHSAESKDLLVVGPGVLGSYAGKLWKESNPSARVVGVTNTNKNHARLEKLGLEPVTQTELALDDKFPFVLFSAPPSGSPDYPAAVAAACAHWDAGAPGGSCVFTSSMGVCAVDDGSVVTEDACPLVQLGGPQDRLLLAEQAVLKAGGNVVRLAGLYHAQRGAHTYFLRAGRVQRAGDAVVNLVHYEDAARLAVAVLSGVGSGPYRGRVFLGCDNHPITFRDMMAACAASGMYEGEVAWLLPDQGPHRGKRVDNSATRALLGGWAPKYESFKAFMEAGAKDWYNTSGLL